jgi:hypothetical protein
LRRAIQLKEIRTFRGAILIPNPGKAANPSSFNQEAPQ